MSPEGTQGKNQEYTGRESRACTAWGGVEDDTGFCLTFLPSLHGFMSVSSLHEVLGLLPSLQTGNSDDV